MITLAIALLSPKPSERGEREIDRKAGVWRKYESCRVLTGELDRAGLPSGERIAFAKSSIVICSEQSTTACDRPKTFAATCKPLATEYRPFHIN
jgi:hypothetical protein